MSNQSSGELPEKNDEVTFSLAEEELQVTREQSVKSRVKVTRSTSVHDETVNMLLRREKVKVTHVAKNQRVSAVPEIREENGVLIVPVVEEEVEIIRRLVLKEELHIHKVEEEIPFEETVSLRRQQVSVQREDGDVTNPEKTEE